MRSVLTLLTLRAAAPIAVREEERVVGTTTPLDPTDYAGHAHALPQLLKQALTGAVPPLAGAPAEPVPPSAAVRSRSESARSPRGTILS